MVYMQPSSPLNITGLWTQAQFNVFGENNGVQAIFPEGATMLNETTIRAFASATLISDLALSKKQLHRRNREPRCGVEAVYWLTHPE